LFALQAAENSAQRQAGFAADRAESDDKVIWDEAEEVEDAGSQATVESSSATHGDEGSEELVDSGEPLSHSSKFLGPSLLRDWFEDDDGEAGSTATLGGIALHVATAAAAGVQAPRSWICQSPQSHIRLLRSWWIMKRLEVIQPTSREGLSRLSPSRLRSAGNRSRLQRTCAVLKQRR
jgi:hypothetical protein